MGRREVIGAGVILVGLALFVYFGDPAGGKENASNTQWAITIGLLTGLSVLLLVFGSSGGLTMKAAVYGTVAGLLFGLSSALTKPTLEYLHESVGTMLSHWECYALAIAGVLGFVLQQVSLGTGRLAPSVATVSVANPVVGILIGMLLLDESLSRPAWHIVLAVIGLSLALVGAVVISLAREVAKGEASATPAPDRRGGVARPERCDRDAGFHRCPLRDRRGSQPARPDRDVRRHSQRTSAYERHRIPDRLPHRDDARLHRRADRRPGDGRRVQLARRPSRTC